MKYSELKQASLKQLKSSIKLKPINSLLLPVFFWIKFKNRWNKVGEIIYLIQTHVKSHPLIEKKIFNEIEHVIHGNIEDCTELINQRISSEKMSPEYYKNVKKRFELGDKMVAIYKSGHYLSSLFVSTKKAVIEQVNQEIELEPNQYCIYDVYTTPENRKKGFYEVVLSITVRHYYNSGYDNFLLWVMNTNQTSKIAHNKLMINNVTRIYTEKYKFGFRKTIIKNYNGYLSEFIS
jgi:hypothetical protein